jgi:GT2 family glycosyltransferase
VAHQGDQPLRDCTISVIVPAYNAAATLDRCLAALGEQTRPPDEVIVVDDGSTDDSADIARHYGVRVLCQVNAGPAAARNAGARAACGDLLLFTDADCAPAPDWLEHMVAPFADPAVVGAKGVYGTTQKELVARFVQFEYEDKYDRMRGQECIDFIDTYSAAYRRDAFLSVGGFDESFAFLEDQELSFRMAKSGHRFVFVPGAVVHHRHADNLFWYAHKKYTIGYWKASVTLRHPAKLARDSHTPQILKLQVGLAGVSGVLLMLAIVLQRIRLVRWAFGCWSAFGLSTLPFLRKAWHKDPVVVLLSPLLLFVRAWALGVGFAAGSLRWLTSLGRVCLGQRE